MPGGFGRQFRRSASGRSLQKRQAAHDHLAQLATLLDELAQSAEHITVTCKTLLLEGEHGLMLAFGFGLKYAGGTKLLLRPT